MLRFVLTVFALRKGFLESAVFGGKVETQTAAGFWGLGFRECCDRGVPYEDIKLCIVRHLRGRELEDTTNPNLHT